MPRWYTRSPIIGGWFGSAPNGAGATSAYALRLSRGRNHRTDTRVERAARVWAIDHTFAPAQVRSERKRHDRRSGLSPLALAGVPPGDVSYLDALAV